MNEIRELTEIHFSTNKDNNFEGHSKGKRGVEEQQFFLDKGRINKISGQLKVSHSIM